MVMYTFLGTEIVREISIRIAYKGTGGREGREGAESRREGSGKRPGVRRGREKRVGRQEGGGGRGGRWGVREGRERRGGGREGGERGDRVMEVKKEGVRRGREKGEGRQEGGGGSERGEGEERGKNMRKQHKKLSGKIANGPFYTCFLVSCGSRCKCCTHSPQNEDWTAVSSSEPPSNNIRFRTSSAPTKQE